MNAALGFEEDWLVGRCTVYIGGSGYHTVGISNMDSRSRVSGKGDVPFLKAHELGASMSIEFVEFPLQAQFENLVCFFLECLTAFGRGGASVPNRPLGEGCLSGASSLAILFGTEAEEPPWQWHSVWFERTICLLCYQRNWLIDQGF